MSDDTFTAARPRTLEELGKLRHRPEVVAAAKERGVTAIVHFTTKRGAVGVLASGAVKSRLRLPGDEYLEHVYNPNSNVRKDADWLDYVNLSVERINDWMFGASERWHAAEGNPWVVLSFDPEILGHPGVVFATTNNIYPACRRAEGLTGFTRMFADEVAGRYGTVHRRSGKRPAWTTDRQAEVLYPGQLSCRHLRKVLVQREDAVDTIEGVLGALRFERGYSQSGVCVLYAPEVFR